MKDFATAQQLISRHKKFLGLKKLKPEDHVLYQFFDIANQIIRFHQKGTKPTAEKLEAIQKLDQGKLTIYEIIVDKMMGGLRRLFNSDKVLFKLSNTFK